MNSKGEKWGRGKRTYCTFENEEKEYLSDITVSYSRYHT